MRQLLVRFYDYDSIWIILVAIFGGIIAFLSPRVFSRTLPSISSMPEIPFVVLTTDNEDKWNILTKTVETFKQDSSNALQQLSASLQVALETEMRLSLEERPGAPLLSDSLQATINRLAEITDQEGNMLENILLRPFTVAKTLPDASSNQTSTHNIENSTIVCNKSTNFTRYYSLGYSDHLHVYNSATQVLAHLVRDWTSEGAYTRRSLYPWCREQLPRSIQSPILIPGAGLGRLAYEVAASGYRVQALEISWSMCATASAILNQKARGYCHPYILDAFTNQVYNQDRFTRIKFPDLDLSSPVSGSLSYSIGDFVSAFSTSTGIFGAVVTCFFLDTATNVYEYVQTIHRILEPAGYWINVGPLQWHRNTRLPISANELQSILLQVGFVVEKWSVDSKPIPYRSGRHGTYYEGYCPIRFVARKHNGHG